MATRRNALGAPLEVVVRSGHAADRYSDARIWGERKRGWSCRLNRERQSGSHVLNLPLWHLTPFSHGPLEVLKPVADFAYL